MIALVRRGQSAAFETIVARYQARLLAFCRHLVASREDAEDVLQEVFAAAFNAMLADRREINLRPWLYRIARNRCLNHLRRQTSIGVDSMDVHFADGGASIVEKVAGRENFRLLMADIRRLPETQRTALLLREMDALSYDQIAEAMETTVPGVKSLLVRARISLGEAAEARKLTCSEVRLELGAIAEGLATASPAIRRHVKDCEPCHAFRAHLRANNRVLAAMLPVGPLLLFKKFALAKLGLSVGAGGAGATATAGSSGAAAAGGAAGATGAVGAASAVGAAGAAGAAGAVSVVGGSTAGAITAGAVAAKAVAGLAAAALVTAGAVEVQQAPRPVRPVRPAVAQVRTPPVAIRPPVPQVIVSAAQPTTAGTPLPSAAALAAAAATAAAAAKAQAKAAPAKAPPIQIAAPVELTPVPPVSTTTQQVSNVSVLPPQPGSPTTPGTTTGLAGGPTTTATSTPATPAPGQTTTSVQAVGPTTTGAISTGSPAQPVGTATPVATTSPPTATGPAGSPTQQVGPGATQTPVTAGGTSPASSTQLVGGATGSRVTPSASGSTTSTASTTVEILGGAVVTTPSGHSRRPASRVGHGSSAEAKAPKRLLQNVGRSDRVGRVVH
ncbi:MAG TPA: sigma-70 family RNA polymerase sigma factor [Solirubrobacteraceae bacterium]|nr:sigma-70 family RNA polymerase sigma factor [Solirubrobacteraceae bacterium]